MCVLSLLVLLLTSTSTIVAQHEVQEQCTLMQSRSIRQTKQTHLQSNRQHPGSGNMPCFDKIVKVGVGGCYDGAHSPGSLGWSASTCGRDKPSFAYCIPKCPNVEACKDECLKNPECGGFMYTHSACWMFKKMIEPSVKYNDPHSWYTCYKKENCCPSTHHCPPFKTCSAWGDPHYTNSFFNGSQLFDFQGIGLFDMASTKDNSFQLQAFQCPYNKKGMATFAGLAMKVGDSIITIMGNNVTIDGEPFLGGDHASGLSVQTVYAKNDRTEFHAPNNGVHLSSITFAHSPSPMDYFQNIEIKIAEDLASETGICGSEKGRDHVPANKSLFSAVQLKYLCDKCSIENCEEMKPPDDWVPINTPEDACKVAGINISVARKKCAALNGDESFMKGCIYDYCASDGSKDLVDSAKESKQEQEKQKKNFNPEEVPITCGRPYKSCTAWGDPHWTNSFFDGKFDFQGVGVFKLAASKDGKFEVQAFQCPYNRTTWASVFAGFAVNVGGSVITIIENNIRINGRLFVGTSHASGLKVEGSHKPRDTVQLDTSDSCIHFKVKSHFNWTQSPGYGHDLFLDMSQAVITAEGICGSSSARTALKEEENLFSDSELRTMMISCNMSNAALLEQAHSEGQPAHAADACTKAGIPIYVATEVCKKSMPDEDPTYLADCIFDYCASGGDNKSIEVAVEAEEEDIDMKTSGSV